MSVTGNEAGKSDETLLEQLGVQSDWQLLWIGKSPSPSFSSEKNILILEDAAELSNQLPYGSKEFDLVVCRDMLQKVKDPAAFCSELNRIAKRGFIEAPSSFNEYLYGNPDSLWLCDCVDEKLVLHPRSYLRHPLAHAGRKLYYTDTHFRYSFDSGHRGLFFIKKYWEDSLDIKVEGTAATDSDKAFNVEDPIHRCVSWLDFALNSMDMELPELDKDIRLSLLHANAIMPGNKIGLAVAELYEGSKESGNKDFYRQLVSSLRQQDLEQAVRTAHEPPSGEPGGVDPNKLHYAILREAYRKETRHPLVSVIIRTYNREELLTRCLHRLNEQIYPSIEIIVVNDGGIDISHIIKECHYPCHYVRHADNKGKAAALNTGLRMARGTYINILDDDDLVYPDHIALLVSALENSDYRVAYADSFMSIESQVNGEWRSVSKKLVYSQPHHPNLLLRTNYLPVLSVLFEKSLLSECGDVDERLEVLEDWDLWIRLAHKTDFYHVRQVTSEYTQRAYGDNATQELAASFDYGRKRILQKYAEWFNDDPVQELFIMPRQYRKRLLSVLFVPDSPEQIKLGLEAFTLGFQEVPWAELTLALNLEQEAFDSIKSETVLLVSDAVQFVRLEEISDRPAFDNQFDYVIAGDVKAFHGLADHVKGHPLFGSLYRLQRKEPLLSLIVLTKNQLDYTKLCVDSIFRHTRLPFELIIVDNGSTDGTKSYLNQLAAENSNVKLIINIDNNGYGGGNNQGIACASGDLLVIMNNDVIVTEDWIGGMIRALKSSPRCGIVGPVSNYVPAPQLVHDPLYTVNELDAYAADHRKAYAGEILGADRVIGFCMLVKKEVIDTIGGFDLRYEYGNFEDDDFCIRASLAGYECTISRDVFIHHFGSTTFKNDKSLNYENIYHANFFKFMSKWNIPVAEDGTYRGWTKSDIPQRTFQAIEHYCPLVPDRSVTSLLQQSSELFLAQRFTECEAVLLQCLAIHGEQPVIRYNLLVNYMQTKNTNQAAQCFNVLDEMTLDIGYLKVIWYAWEKRFEDAEELLERLLGQYSGHPQLIAAREYVKQTRTQLSL